MDVDAVLEKLRPPPVMEIPEPSPAKDPETIQNRIDYMLFKGWRDFDPEATGCLAGFLLARKLRQNTRGLLIEGKTGTGKTTWMRLFGPRPFYETPLICRWYGEFGWEFVQEKLWFDPYEGHPCPRDYYVLGLDDLGHLDEPEAVRRYGTEFHPIAEIIEQQYRLWKRYGRDACLYITTNLTSDEIDKRYGKRILSRLTEMCNFTTINDIDHRME